MTKRLLFYSSVLLPAFDVSSKAYMGNWATCMRSIMLVPIIDPRARHDTGLCADVSDKAHRLDFNRRCALLQGQVTSNMLEI